MRWHYEPLISSCWLGDAAATVIKAPVTTKIARVLIVSVQLHQHVRLLARRLGHRRTTPRRRMLADPP
jgi:hypothetical protein